MSYDWKPFAGTEAELPPVKRYVLVQTTSPLTLGTYPPVVAVGYLKFAGGDEDCPYFVVPGVGGGDATHWCDCLGDDFVAPGWPGSYTLGNKTYR